MFDARMIYRRKETLRATDTDTDTVTVTASSPAAEPTREIDEVNTNWQVTGFDLN